MNLRERPREIAILYRTNAQSRALEESLRRRGIPYRLIGAVRFYDRREVRDLLAWLRLAANPSDDEAFRRAVSVPGARPPAIRPSSRSPWQRGSRVCRDGSPPRRRPHDVRAHPARGRNGARRVMRCSSTGLASRR